MWRTFKWDMFVTSFIPLWISIIVIDVWNIISITLKNWKQANEVIVDILDCLYICKIQLISVIIISFVVLHSVHKTNSFLKKLSNSNDRSKGKVIKAIKANKLSSEFLIAYILPMIAFNFGDIQNITLFLICFAVLAYLCIRNNNIYTNILLEFKGYRMYTCDLECFILEKKYIYHDSLIISKYDLTQEEGNSVTYWDFDNYIYITIDEGEK